MSPLSGKRRQKGEGSIYLRGDGLWVGVLNLGWRDGKRRRKVVYGKTQAEAVRKLGKAKRDQAAGQLTTTTTTVKRWMETWLADVAPQHEAMKPNTLHTYEEKARNYIVPNLGHHRLDKLTPAHVRGMRTWITREKGLSSTTAMHAHRVLSVALRDAVREGLITRNVASRDYMDAPTKAAGTRQPLSLPEALAVLRQVADDRLGSRWLMALLTGLRQGETLGATWGHVDLDRGLFDLAWQLQRIPYRHGCITDSPPKGGSSVKCGRKTADRCPKRRLAVDDGEEYRQLDGNLCLLRPKSQRSKRLIPLPDPLVTALRTRHDNYLAERHGYTVDHGLVWCRPDGRPLDPRQDYQQWQDALKAVGIPIPRALHATRHTTATLLLALGVPENVIQAILGHSDVVTTRGYAHVDVTLARQALSGLGERLSIEPRGVQARPE